MSRQFQFSLRGQESERAAMARFQFSLKTLFIVTTLAAGFTWIWLALEPGSTYLGRTILVGGDLAACGAMWMLWKEQKSRSSNSDNGSH